jgi:hypothetical protein
MRYFVHLRNKLLAFHGIKILQQPFSFIGKINFTFKFSSYPRESSFENFNTFNVSTGIN